MKCLTLLAIAAGTAVLSGCAGLQQVVDAGTASAAVSLRAAEDSNIRLWTFNACATPLSATIRNPHIIPALRALCLPDGGSANPGLLLEAPR
jgi:hypothetical protein